MWSAADRLLLLLLLLLLVLVIGAHKVKDEEKH
jgi:hypothetical protein